MDAASRPPLQYVTRWTVPSTNQADPNVPKVGLGSPQPAQSSPQPFISEHLQGYHFVFKGDQERLKGLCNRFLNQPTASHYARTYGPTVAESLAPYKYTPAADLIFLAFTRAWAFYCQDGFYRQMGWSAESSATVFVPLFKTDPQGISQLIWFIPYIFVDNPISVVLGREVYGMPKEQGWISLPAAPGAPRELCLFVRDAGIPSDPLSLDCFSIRQFHPDSRASRLRLLAVRRDDQPDRNGEGENESFKTMRKDRSFGNLFQELADAIKRAVSDETKLALPGLGQELKSAPLPLVFFKQFYAVEDGGSACYQAVVEAEIQHSNPHGAGLLKGNYRLTLCDSDFHPLGQDLGLQDDQPALASYWADVDTRMDPGRTVWEAHGR